MMPASLSLFLLLISSTLFYSTAAGPYSNCFQCIDTHGNYTSNRTYSKNLNRLLSIIASDARIDNAYGFYDFTVGESDKVYGTATCWVDQIQSVEECRSCLQNAMQSLLLKCPIQKEAVAYNNGICTLRYSDRPISITENSPNCTVTTWKPLQIPESYVKRYKQAFSTLLDGLKQNASVGDPSSKFATGITSVTSSIQIYALAQCNPQLSPIGCSTCLQKIISELLLCCSNQSGAAIYGLACGLQFDNYPFPIMASSTLQPSADAHPLRNVSVFSSGKARDHTYRTSIIVAVLLVFLVLFATLMFSLISRRNIRKKQQEEEKGNEQVNFVDFTSFDFRTIQAATNDFSDVRRLGKGGTSRMFKGVLPNGQEVAVERIYKSSREGQLEFDNEVRLSANLQHKNLVKLLGFCIEKDSQLLVYEFLPNGSLDGILRDPVKRACLDWQTRHNIILGLARGLLYLHEDSHLRVIHRDLKAGIVLLGVDMDAKISCFKNAILIQSNQTRGTKRVVGTYGYMPPEYANEGHSSIKSDIFSFGVIMLEIISGQLISSFSDGIKQENLLTFAWRKWTEGMALDVVDQSLLDIDKHVHLKQILRCVKIALLCVEEDPTHRPIMSTVVFMLNSDIVDIAEPSRPALLLSDIDSQSNANVQTNDSHEASINEVSISYIDPR